MINTRIVLVLGFFLFTQVIYSQVITLCGKVYDEGGKPVFATNIFLSKHNTIGTTTDFEGQFSLPLSDDIISGSDTLVFSFIGYNTRRLPLGSINLDDSLIIFLTESAMTLNAIVVEARKSISREFSIKTMDKMQIYLNPLASADPLKALAILPSSTNTSETANPELRGSSASRTRVLLNGVPVSNPVRNSQINGFGFFSLFNPDLIKSELIYPSHPPLIYGNSSAGMIELETNDELKNNRYQVSSSLASVGICISTQIKKSSFVQLYGNLMFSQGIQRINPNAFKHLQYFNSNDAGINFHSQISEHFSLNLYNYLVAESSDVLLNILTWNDNAKAKTTRDFTILNLKYQKQKNYFWVNLGTNFNRSSFAFGNMKSICSQHQLYISMNYKYQLSEKASLQTGISNELWHYRFHNELPVYYYALSPSSPSYHEDTTLHMNLPEAYLYWRFKPIPKIILGFGMRKNLYRLPGNNPGYLSLQANIRYNFLPDHSLLVSAGRYHSITEPSYGNNKLFLLSAHQVSLEYLYKTSKTNISLSGYYKHETGDTTGHRKISGIEIMAEHYLFRSLKIILSNTFLNTDLADDDIYNTDSKVPGYFLVTTLSYNNSSIINVSVSWLNRQGRLYVPVQSSLYDPVVEFYQPLYHSDHEIEKFDNYNTINLVLSKSFIVKKISLLIYGSVFNILNTSNQKNLVYNHDYSEYHFNYYQKRSLYFGLVMSMTD